MNWLAERCDEVWIVAHSQGCAVTYLALRESVPEPVRDVTWFGSGLRKLEMLREAEYDAWAIARGWAIVLMPPLLWQLLTARWRWEDLLWNAGFFAVVALAYFLGVLSLSGQLRVGGTDFWLHRWRSPRLHLREVYASHDPVPGGPLFDANDTGVATTLESQCVQNRASLWADHTSYWSNLEQVVLPLSLRLAAALGVSAQALRPQDAALLQQAVRRRQQRVRVLRVLRAVLFAGVAAVLLRQVTLLHETLQQVAAAMEGVFTDAPAAVLTPVLATVGQLAAWTLLPYAGLLLAWRAWDMLEQRALLLRKEPGYCLHGLTLMLLLMAAFLPAARAAVLVWAGTVTGGEVALLALMLAMAAYALALFLRDPTTSPSR